MWAGCLAPGLSSTDRHIRPQTNVYTQIYYKVNIKFETAVSYDTIGIPILSVHWKLLLLLLFCYWIKVDHLLLAIWPPPHRTHHPRENVPCACYVQFRFKWKPIKCWKFRLFSCMWLTWKVSGWRIGLRYWETASSDQYISVC